jgi:hypothetical protein
LALSARRESHTLLAGDRLQRPAAELRKSGVKKVRTLSFRRAAGIVILLLLLAAIVTGLLVYRNFSRQVTASNHRLPRATRSVLPKRRSVLSQPQLLLVRFDQASLFLWTNPSRHLVSLLSVPSTAYATSDGTRETIADAYASSGTAGLIRFTRATLGLTTTHVAVVEPGEVAPLVEAVGGVEVRDPSYAVTSGRGDKGNVSLDGPGARRYLESAGGIVRRDRERIVLEAVVARLMSGLGFSTLMQVAREFPKTVATDLSPQDAVALAFVRLRAKNFVACGTEGGSSLISPANRQALQQFLGDAPAPAQTRHLLPESGCRVSPVRPVGVPAAVVSVAGATLAIFPLLPAIAIGVAALDLLVLLLLLQVPHRLVGVGREVPALVGAGLERLAFGSASSGASTSAAGGRHGLRLPDRRVKAATGGASRATADRLQDPSVETRSPPRVDPAPPVAPRQRTWRGTRSRSRSMLARAPRSRPTAPVFSSHAEAPNRGEVVRSGVERPEKRSGKHPLRRFHPSPRQARWPMPRSARANWQVTIGAVALSALIGYLVTRL